ncbi:hypothetical protein [Mesorhizobium sp. SP-1A]|uniref:hypothetical protein n=1 Tax=Mesorhizobium sp. SP-1A TaxID=3077840 RepID=UPI0028F72FD3|nr:hypothetical protein [Mesorhizobium sp. SP-1A]
MQFDFAMFFAYFGCLSFIGAMFVVMAVGLDRKITVFDVISYVSLVLIGTFCVGGYMAVTKPIPTVIVAAEELASE